MTKQNSMIVGFILLILCFVIMWLWFGSTKTDEDIVNSLSKKIVPANAELLSNNSLKNLETRVINGNIPVQVEENYNNEDIFN